MALFTTTRQKLAAAAVAGLAVVGGGTAAWAATATSASAAGSTPAASTTLAASTTPATNGSTTSTGSATSAAAKAAKAKRVRGVLARTDHATVELKQKGTWVTVTYDRGKVTAASATSVTLARPDGQTVTIDLGSATHYRGITAASQLQVGKTALVVSDNGQALRVSQKATS